MFSAAYFATVPPAPVIGTVKAMGVPRLPVVGSAGSLFAAPGLKVIDTPGFPYAYGQEVAAGGVFLDARRAESTLDWTFLSPSAEFVGGEFRLGGDDLLVSAQGRSWIRFADFAIALLDELEQPKHSRRRFTIGH